MYGKNYLRVKFLVREGKSHRGGLAFSYKINLCHFRKEVIATQNIFLLKYLFAGIGNILATAALVLIFTICRDTTPLTAQFIYYIFATFRTLTFDVGTRFTRALYKMAEFYISAQRIQLFLHLTDQQQDSEIAAEFPDSGAYIRIEGLSFSIKNKIILTNVNCTFSRGLTLVTGSIGSGKSSFLQIILNEYQTLKGSIKVGGSIAFASQDPWLFPSTIRQNILFGQKYDHARYQNVLDQCCLSYDLNLLDAGDLTLLEDRGHNLSKGQQIRINLARAIYKNADIYLLDNCLGSLDTNVKNSIFENCLKGLLNDKIVILVVQDNSYNNKADKIISLDNNISKQAPDHNSEIKYLQNLNIIKTHSSNDCNKQFIQEKFDEKTKLLNNKTNNEIYREFQNSSSISLKLYHKYISYGGGYIVALLIVLTFIATQTSFAYRNILLSKW